MVTSDRSDDLYVAVYIHNAYGIQAVTDNTPQLITSSTTQRIAKFDLAVRAVEPCPVDTPFFVVAFKRVTDANHMRVIYERVGFATMTPDTTRHMDTSKTRQGQMKPDLHWMVSLRAPTGEFVAQVSVVLDSVAIVTDRQDAKQQQSIATSSLFTNASCLRTMIPRVTREVMFSQYQARVDGIVRSLAGGTRRNRAVFPSGQKADMELFVVPVNTHNLPILLYFAANAMIPLVCIDALATQMVLLACVQLNVTPQEFRERAVQTDRHSVMFMRKFLVTSIKVIAAMMTYSNDSEGENFNFPWQLGSYAYAQSDCEELTSTCMLLFRVLCNSTCALASELRNIARRFVFCAMLVTSQAGGGYDTMHMTGCLYPRNTLRVLAGTDARADGSVDTEPTDATWAMEPLVIDAMVNTDCEPSSKRDYSRETDVALALQPMRTLFDMTRANLYKSALRMYAVDVCIEGAVSNSICEYIPLTRIRDGHVLGTSVPDLYQATTTCKLHAISPDAVLLDALRSEVDESMFINSFSVNEKQCMTEDSATELIQSFRSASCRKGRCDMIVRIVFCMRTESTHETTDWARHMRAQNDSMNKHYLITDGSLVYVMNNVVAYPYALCTTNNA